MRRKGPAYPIDDTWRGRVRDRIVELKISQNELARRAKITKSVLSEALSPDSQQSNSVPAIHKALGWPPPMPLVLSPDVRELLDLYNAMNERDQGETIGAAREKVAQIERRRTHR